MNKDVGFAQRFQIWWKILACTHCLRYFEVWRHKRPNCSFFARSTSLEVCCNKVYFASPVAHRKEVSVSPDRISLTDSSKKDVVRIMYDLHLSACNNKRIIIWLLLSVLKYEAGWISTRQQSILRGGPHFPHFWRCGGMRIDTWLKMVECEAVSLCIGRF